MFSNACYFHLTNFFLHVCGLFYYNGCQAMVTEKLKYVEKSPKYTLIRLCPDFYNPNVCRYAYKMP